MSKSRTSLSIRFSDIDLGGHVHNSKYLDFFEAGRIDLLQQFIPSDNDWARFGLILARNEVDYLLPVRLEDDLVIETSVREIGSKSFTLSYEVFIVNGEEQKPCSKGLSVMVCYNYNEQKSANIPANWRSQLEKLL